MPKKIKVGVIGTGGIANAAHLPGYAQLPDECEIYALCDIDPAALERTRAKFPVQHAFDDYQKLLELDELDAVSICTPNYAHYLPTVDALKAGKHVICEKPIAMNAAEAAEMVKTSRQTGKILQIGYCHRFANTNQTLKRYIDAGELGEIYYAHATAMRVRGIPGWGVFIDKEKQGGGPLIDIGVHILDLTLWLMGHPKPISASGVTYQKFGKRPDVVGFLGQWDHTKFTVEDFASALIRFENGATVVLESSFCANIQKDSFSTQILGTNGGAETDPFRIVQEKHHSIGTYEPKIPNPNNNTYSAEIKDFIACIQEGREPLVTGEHGLMVAQIMDAIYQSSELGREVKI